jgi:hypothetical protein
MTVAATIFGSLGFFASDDDGFALKIDVAVAEASVSTWLDFDYIAIVGVVYCRLDIVKIGWAVIIDSDYPRLAGKDQKQKRQTEKQFFHLKEPPEYFCTI